MTASICRESTQDHIPTTPERAHQLLGTIPASTPVGCIRAVADLAKMTVSYIVSTESGESPTSHSTHSSAVAALPPRGTITARYLAEGGVIENEKASFHDVIPPVMWSRQAQSMHEVLLHLSIELSQGVQQVLETLSMMRNSFIVEAYRGGEWVAVATYDNPFDPFFDATDSCHGYPVRVVMVSDILL